MKIELVEGTRVDFVPDRGRSHGPGGSHGSAGVPEGHVLHSFENAEQDATGVRKRGVIDEITTVGDVVTYRLMLDGGDLVWCEAGEIDVLDGVSQLGALVDSEPTLKDGLDAIDSAVECCDCGQMTDTPFWAGRSARCGACRIKKLGIA